MKIYSKNLKIFLSSMAGSILIITLLCGLVIVEKSTRVIAFGDNSPFFVCEHNSFVPTFIKVHFMGKDYTLSTSR